MRSMDNTNVEDDLRAEYDLSQLRESIRGKYVQRYREGANLVLLDPDVAKAFPSEEAVNEALRMLMRIADAHVGRG
jgi:hypothetical protein